MFHKALLVLSAVWLSGSFPRAAEPNNFTLLSVNSPDFCSQLKLTHWWRGESNGVDSVGTAQGTLINGTAFAPGKVGNGFAFDGISSCVVITNSSGLVSSNYSVEAWVKPDGFVVDHDNQDLIFGQAFGQAQMTVHAGGYGLKVFWQFSETVFAFPAAVSKTEIPMGLFSHLVGTWDGEALRLYVNGNLEAETFPAGEPEQTACPYFIGGFQNACGYTGQYFKGIIDEVSIYGKALTSEEVQALYSAGNAGKCQLQLEFNDGIPASWRLQYFGANFLDNPQALAVADPDDDGANNYQEYLSGTNPLQSNSVRFFPLLRIIPGGGEFTNAVQVGYFSTLTNAVVRYTRDGSVPQSYSPAFPAAMLITNAVTLQARSFINDIPVSDVESASFARIYALNDGLPNSWREHFFGPSFRTDPRVGAEADPDADGANNFQEFAAGTDPLDPKSVLRTSVRLLPMITWGSVTNRVYRVLRRPSLSSTNVVAVTPFLQPTNSVSSFIDFDVTGIGAVYYIEVKDIGAGN